MRAFGKSIIQKHVYVLESVFIILAPHGSRELRFELIDQEVKVPDILSANGEPLRTVSQTGGHSTVTGGGKLQRLHQTSSELGLRRTRLTRKLRRPGVHSTINPSHPSERREHSGENMQKITLHEHVKPRMEIPTM